jgi:hypothetical protein
LAVVAAQVAVLASSVKAQMVPEAPRQGCRGLALVKPVVAVAVAVAEAPMLVALLPVALGGIVAMEVMGVLPDVAVTQAVAARAARVVVAQEQRMAVEPGAL